MLTEDSESSLFVAPHSLILKTCGTTLNLLGLPRIIEIARQYCGYTNIWRCFYSRKSFFFPERQMGPHRDWGEEVKYLDSIFGESVRRRQTKWPADADHRLERVGVHRWTDEQGPLAAVPDIAEHSAALTVRLVAHHRLPAFSPGRGGSVCDGLCGADDACGVGVGALSRHLPRHDARDPHVAPGACWAGAVLPA